MLGRAFGYAHALQTNGEPRTIHHREHAGHAFVLFPDKEADGSALVAIDHRAGGRRMDAQLVFDRMRAHIVPRAVRHNLRHKEK